MQLRRLEISGFKSFVRKSVFLFDTTIAAIVGPNGSGKSNVAEAIRFVLGEQSMKSLRGKRGEDLIWNGSASAPRGNHASVSLIFDNSMRAFDIDYDEVTLRRDVERDGTNAYFVNGTQVRLRDILELLAKVHIGATGHHIISQGEADRILNAGIKDRRTMVEEALGLKLYQWKIEESEKKLVKTEENMKQVESLRREIAPHIKFLKKQVEKVEQAENLCSTLKEHYAEYLKREKEYLSYHKSTCAKEKKGPAEKFATAEKGLIAARALLSGAEEGDPKKGELVRIEGTMSSARTQKDTLTRELGRIEGMIAYEAKRREKVATTGEEKPIPFSAIKRFSLELEETLEELFGAITVESAQVVGKRIQTMLRGFVLRFKEASVEDTTEDTQALHTEKKTLEEKLRVCIKENETLERDYLALKKEIEERKESASEAEKQMFALMAEKSALEVILSRIASRENILERDTSALEEEIQEGVALVGRDILLYENFVVSPEEVVAEAREAQEGRHKKIERMKLRLEDLGAGGGEDTLKEYNDAVERDEFLGREITDMEITAASLRSLIAELSEKLDIDFKEGIKKINTQFQDFFALMFGGGTASLSLIAPKKRRRNDIDMALLSDDEALPEEEEEEGIEINVSLPRKKIRGLQMLSGGERALTSIALIFAVSQVNPPPFLVLDETDAALDEANSKKYGDMLENLSRHSQLIVVTHNRETMSRAGLLYGITMGSDATSKLLSVRFEEAAAFAK